MKKRTFLHLLLVILLLALGGLASFYLLHTRPKIKKRRLKPHIPIVEVLKVYPRSYQLRVEGFGTVQPLRTGQIVPEVAGKVIYLSPHLVAGGRFKKGELLLKIDPRDYEAALALAKAELKDARQKLAQIEAEARSARLEWKDIMRHKTPPPPLVARVPQLEAAKARVSAARAKVEKAALDLARTEIKAPFEGIVLETNVELGQYVSPGVTLAKVYDTSAVEVRLPLESKFLPWLKIPGFNTSKDGSPARVTISLGQEVSFPGRVVRSAALVDEKTRLLDLFVQVKDPFKKNPPLLPGFFARVEILGRKVSGVYVLPRPAVHLEGERWFVWVVKKGRLQKRWVDILYFVREEALVKKGLNPGDEVVLSRLAGPFPGMKVRPKP